MNILTLTMNPVLDKSTNAEIVLPDNKLRCSKPDFDAGGGGINVSRAIHKLGGNSIAHYLAGGDYGKKINTLLQKEGIETHLTDSGTETRENLRVFDKTTENLYRFGMPGPEISKKKWQNVLSGIKNTDPKPDYIIASGSLPSGVPDDYYADIAEFAKNNEIRMVIDTSGKPLKKALDKGVYLFKPNLRELAYLLDMDLLTAMDQEKAAIEIMNSNKCKIMVLSLGSKGAMLGYGEDKIEYITPPTMPVISTVGAGDSMVAGIMIGLSRGYSISDAVSYGVAAGTAASMTPGSELCKKDDTDTIYNWLKQTEKTYH